MDDGHAADMVCIEFAKGFLSVSHRFLLKKLESFGLCDNLAFLLVTP